MNEDRSTALVNYIAEPSQVYSEYTIVSIVSTLGITPSEYQSAMSGLNNDCMSILVQYVEADYLV
jgi:hypothetical protein